MPTTDLQVVSHSLLKSFRRCPKQADYKFQQGLRPRMTGKPLRRGTWVHKLLEVHYAGGDWKEEHQRLTNQFYTLFEEERDLYGDMPKEIARVMRGYFWHYKHDHWKVHDVEFILETTFPDGTVYRCKIDVLVEDQFGLWLVDHKSNKTLPDLTFRMLDGQSALYVWCALRNKIPVQGFIWNYIRWKPPTIPYITQGGRLSRRKLDTDYPTLLTTLKKHDLVEDNQEMLDALRKRQYRPGAPQTSTFFRRDILEKSPDMLKRVATENYHTSKRYFAYPWDNQNAVERVVSRSCSFDCSYQDLCSIELFGGDPRTIRKQRYEIDPDPFSYQKNSDDDDDTQG